VAQCESHGGLRMIYVWARRESFEKLESWQTSRGRQFLRNRTIDRAQTLWGKVAGSLFQPHLSSDLKHHSHHHHHQYHHHYLICNIAHSHLLSFTTIDHHSAVLRRLTFLGALHRHHKLCSSFSSSAQNAKLAFRSFLWTLSIFSFT